MLRTALVILVVLLAAGRADAYPQFELAKDQSCSGCHISPTGGGLLTENGEVVAETISKYGTNPAFMYGKIKTPGDWLTVGGDLRYAYGYLQAPQRYLVGFPMQAEVAAALTFGQFTGYVNVGARPATEGNEIATTLWSREHFVMWREHAGETNGALARVGRFMPVFGLRFAEHPVYTRRYGGTPLYADTYAAQVSYLKPEYEVHLTGFVKDPLIDPVQQSSGGAIYGEYTLGTKTSVGAGGMISASSFEHKYRATVTAKQYLPFPDVLVQGELQIVNPHVDDYGFTQLVAYVMGTWFVPGDYGLMVDLGYGHYDENTRIHALDRDCYDLNVHWFATSHVELALLNRLELIGKGEGGPTGAYSLLMIHYRL